MVNEKSCALLTNREHNELSKVNQTIKKMYVWKYSETDLFIIDDKKRTNLGRLYWTRLEI